MDRNEGEQLELCDCDIVIMVRSGESDLQTLQKFQIALKGFITSLVESEVLFNESEIMIKKTRTNVLSVSTLKLHI